MIKMYDDKKEDCPEVNLLDIDEQMHEYQEWEAEYFEKLADEY